MGEPSLSAPSAKAGQKETSSARKWVVYFLKLAISLAIVAALLVKYDTHKVLHSLTPMNMASMFWIWFWMLLGLWFHSWMLQRALLPLGMKFRVLDLYKINFQIRFYGLFLPGATNMLIKWHKLAKPTGQPGEALAVMAFTRMLHTFAMLFLTVLGMLLDTMFPWTHVKIIGAGLLLVVAVSIVLTTSTITGPYMDYIALAVLHRLPRNGVVQRKMQKLWGFFTSFRKIELEGLLILMSLTVVGQIFHTYSQINIAHGAGMDITLATQFWIRGVILICAIVPISFSGLGVREASMVGLMVYYGIPEQSALAYSLAVFGLTVGIGLIGGVCEAYEQFWPVRTQKHRKEVL